MTPSLKQIVTDIDSEFTDEQLHRLEFFRWKQHRTWETTERVEWIRLRSDEISRNEMAKNKAVFERLIPELKDLK